MADRLRGSLRRRGLLMRPRQLRQLSKLAEAKPSFGNQVDVFHEGDLLYESMLGDISLARRQVFFEIYMFRSDDVSWRFAEALARQAKEGVEVRFLYDAVGSLEADGTIFEFLKKQGVQVVEFRPLRPWRRRAGLFGRNHRKIIVVDHRIGYIGGVNVADHWSESRKGAEAWRDTHLRISGPAACDLGLLFAETWQRETGALLSLDQEQESLGEREAKPRERNGGVLIVGGRGRYRGKIRRLYQRQIGQAKSQVFITSSYFVPDRAVSRALCQAAKRQVEVRLLLPDRSDVRLADLAGRHFYARFLRSGIRIYLWGASVLHAKSMIVDDAWGIVGSSNFDSLSLNYNLEANALLFDPAPVESLKARFWSDLGQARELSLEEWRRRPWISRAREWLASLLSPWL